MPGVAGEYYGMHRPKSNNKRLARYAIIIPAQIRIDDAVTDSNKAWAASIRCTPHIGDFTRWKDHDSYSKAFGRLLRDLKAEGA